MIVPWTMDGGPRVSVRRSASRVLSCRASPRSGSSAAGCEVVRRSLHVRPTLSRSGPYHLSQTRRSAFSSDVHLTNALYFLSPGPVPRHPSPVFLRTPAPAGAGPVSQRVALFFGRRCPVPIHVGRCGCPGRSSVCRIHPLRDGRRLIPYGAQVGTDWSLFTGALGRPARTV